MNEDTITTDPSLKDLIKEANYTQKSFAKALNRAYSTVQYYVAGQKMPTGTVIADMCRLLNKSPKTVMKSLGIDVSGIPDDTPSTD